MTEATEENKNRELTPLEKQQVDYLLKEYPNLDRLMIETIIRLSENQRQIICEEIKSGELKPDENVKDGEEVVIKGVSVENPGESSDSE